MLTRLGEFVGVGGPETRSYVTAVTKKRFFLRVRLSELYQ